MTSGNQSKPPQAATLKLHARHRHEHMAHAHGGEYDEDRAGPRHGNNYVSFPKDGVVHKATKKVWPWDPAGNHEQEERVLVPGVFVEALFAHAPVPKPEDLSPVKFLVKCLIRRSSLCPSRPSWSS